MNNSGIAPPDPLPADRDPLPLMPVRRLHNYLYCPRLFYLQWVENLFEENADTVAGSAAHRQTDQPSRYDDEKAEALRTGLPEGSRLRSLKVESVTLGLVGVIDVVEGGPDGLELLDYKKGSARRTETARCSPRNPTPPNSPPTRCSSPRTACASHPPRFIMPPTAVACP